MVIKRIVFLSHSLQWIIAFWIRQYRHKLYSKMWYEAKSKLKLTSNIECWKGISLRQYVATLWRWILFHCDNFGSSSDLYLL